MDKKIPPHNEATFQEINRHFTGDSAKEQCNRFLQALKKFSINIFEASLFLSQPWIGYLSPTGAHLATASKGLSD